MMKSEGNFSNASLFGDSKDAIVICESIHASIIASDE